MKSRVMILLAAIIVFSYTSCDNTFHEFENMTFDEGALAVVLRVSDPELKIGTIHLFIFDKTEKLDTHFYYTDAKDLASHLMYLTEDRYTIVSVMNTGSELMPTAGISLPDFSFWLSTQLVNNPGMYVGMIQKDIVAGEMNLVTITMQKGDGVALANVQIVVKLPIPNLPEYKPSRSTTNIAYQPRCVMEVYHKDFKERIHRREILLTKESEGTDYLLNLSLLSGEYNLIFWVDYVPIGTIDNYHYVADELAAIVLNPEQSYSANTDSRDAFYQSYSITVNEQHITQTVALIRPLAKYRLVATDVEYYNTLVEKNNYPSLDELKITILYEGFFPNSFNIFTEQPNDAITGMKYISQLSDRTTTKAILGSDYVFVNGEESFVTVTIVITDKNDNPISVIKSIPINYRRGYLTTVSGNFLSAGITSGGIHIDTEWDGEYNVDF